MSSPLVLLSFFFATPDTITTPELVVSTPRFCLRSFNEFFSDKLLRCPSTLLTLRTSS